EGTMQTQEAIRRFLPLLALMLNCTVTAFAGEEPDTKEAPKPLPRPIIKAWQDAGAEVGWMNANNGFVSDSDQEQGEAGDIPAFQLALDPVDVGLFRAIGEMPNPRLVANLIEKLHG